MIEESKYCSEVIKNILAKEFVITKKDNENLKNSAKYWICGNDYVDNDVKVRDQCHTTEKYKGSTHRDCNINLKLNHLKLKNLKYYDSHFIMQELGKFNLKINVIEYGLEKYMRFTINNQLTFV